jgi:phosphoserine phosphatase
LTGRAENANASIELEISAEKDASSELRSARVELTREFHISISPSRKIRRNRRRDVRYGFHPIRAEVIDEMAKLYGVGEQAAALTTAAMRGELEFKESLRRRVALLADLPAERLDKVVHSIPLAEGAER